MNRLAWCFVLAGFDAEGLVEGSQGTGELNEFCPWKTT